MKQRLSEDALLLQGQPMFKLLSRVKQIEANDAARKIYHFEIGDPDFDTPEVVKSALYKSVAGGRTHYTDSAGLYEFRDAVRNSIKRSHNFLPEISQVVAVPGANSVIYTTLKVLLNPGDDVILPDPSFPTYASAINFARVKPVYIPLRENLGFRWDMDELERSVTSKTKLIIINSPGNPTGGIFTEDDIKRIYQIAEKHNLFILSDEVYSTILFGDTAFYSPAVFDECKDRVIILDSFSKKYAMTGWRQGFAVAPIDVAEKIALYIMTVNSCVSPFLQEASIAALTKGQTAEAAMTAEYEKRCNLMVDLLNEIPGVDCHKPSGALYCFPNISGSGMTSQEFADFALEHNVALLPGTDFGASGEGFIRLCFANSTANIEAGLKLLKDAVTNKISKTGE
jgi:aspartate/methionine/tyrosine aminotransferase